MKIKSLLFAALVAGMGMTANAETAYTNCGDVLSCNDFEIVAGAEEYTEVTLVLTRQTSPDWTNIQFDLIFPEGLRPVQNAKKRWQTAAPDVCDEGIPFVTWKSNFDNPNKYPVHTYVGSNLEKIPCEANPAQLLTFYVKADADMPKGDYELKAHTLKYTSYDDDAWHTLEEQVVCKVTVENESAINDINTTATVKTRKVVENGQVYIIAGEAKYNVMGQKVK